MSATLILFMIYIHQPLWGKETLAPPSDTTRMGMIFFPTAQASKYSTLLGSDGKRRFIFDRYTSIVIDYGRWFASSIALLWGLITWYEFTNSFGSYPDLHPALSVSVLTDIGSRTRMVHAFIYYNIVFAFEIKVEHSFWVRTALWEDIVVDHDAATTAQVSSTAWISYQTNKSWPPELPVYQDQLCFATRLSVFYY